MAGLASFRRVEVVHDFPVRWKEITLLSGNRIQGDGESDFNEEVSGGYAYRDSGKTTSPTRNRFICWRVKNDVVEFIEESLDVNIADCFLRLCFNGAHILGPVTIHEFHGHIVILLTTTVSVHRFLFPHPCRLQKSDYLQRSDAVVRSIFADISSRSLEDAGGYFILSNTPKFTSAFSHVCDDGSTLFVYGVLGGSLSLIKMAPPGRYSPVVQWELRQTSLVQRLWSGIAMVRGGGNVDESVIGLTVHPVDQNTFIWTICRDHRLRMWSSQSQECVLVTDMLTYVKDEFREESRNVAADHHKVCKSVTSNSQSLVLCVYLSLPSSSQFVLLQPVWKDGRYQLQHLKTVNLPQQVEVMQYSVTSNDIWALWRNQGNHSLSFHRACFAPDVNVHCVWSDVVDDGSTNGNNIFIPSHRDVREVYLDEIFFPGRYNTYTILKALNLYRHIGDSGQLPDVDVSCDALRAEVCTVIEHEVHSVAAEVSEVTEEEYRQIQLVEWSKFHSNILQYHEDTRKPTGIFVDSNTGLVVSIERYISLIRPCDVLEQLYYSDAESCTPFSFSQLHILAQDEELCDDTVAVMKCLKLFRQCLSEEAIFYFNQDVYHLQNIPQVCRHIVEDISSRADSSEILEWFQEIRATLQAIHDLSRCVQYLVTLLDVSHPVSTHDMDIDQEDLAVQLSTSHVFSSKICVEAISKSVYQMSVLRQEICRGLLLLITLAADTQLVMTLEPNAKDVLQTKMMSQLSQLLLSYIIVQNWSSTSVSQPFVSCQETNVRQMEILSTYNCSTYSLVQKFAYENRSLLELFLQSPNGDKELRRLLAAYPVYENDPCELWQIGLIPALSSCFYLMWPRSQPLFGLFLARHCQYCPLQNVASLLNHWTDNYMASWNLLLALSYLNSGEITKASSCFLSTLSSLSSDSFATQIVSGDENGVLTFDIYVLKVLNMFEQLGHSDAVVDVATRILDICPSVSADAGEIKATLWSKIFKHQLELGHAVEAYEAMLNNPSEQRRCDCLRQWLVVMCEKGDIHTVVQMPYRDKTIDLQEEVIKMLECRARSVDLNRYNYYDVLYAFYVQRGIHRQAASVMYECAQRFRLEVPGLRSLQKQAKCYLAVLNSLRLVTAEYAWIIKPNTSTQSSITDGRSPKRNADSEEIMPHKKMKIQVLEVSHIQKEYCILHAHLQFLQVSQDTVHVLGPIPTANELVTLLLSVNLFDTAATLCEQVDIPLLAVFDSLTTKCIRHAQMEVNMIDDEAWLWLQQNNISPSASGLSPVDQAWWLLQDYLKRYENSTAQYHKAVAKRMLLLDFPLPKWLKASYQLIDAPQLLRLYLNFNHLEEAITLSSDYIDAALGKGRDLFALKTYLHANAASVWLPYTCFDQLVTSLKEYSLDSSLSDLAREFERKLYVYLQTVESVSEDVLINTRFQAKC